MTDYADDDLLLALSSIDCDRCGENLACVYLCPDMRWCRVCMDDCIASYVRDFEERTGAFEQELARQSMSDPDLPNERARGTTDKENRAALSDKEDGAGDRGQTERTWAK